MSEWVKTKLGTVLGPDGYIRGPFGSSLLRDELLTQGIPVYEQQHAIYNHRNFRFYIDDQKHKELKRFTVKENDLIISCSGTLGKVSIIKKDDPKGIISQALLILRPHVNNIDIKYLYFFLISPIGFHSIVSVSSGSVQTNIAKRSIIENTDMFLPPLPEQRAIAGVLSSLDDKIDLLHRQNKTLEAMAEALWRKMFVEEAEPEWKKGKLGDLVELCYGKGLKEENRRAGEYPVVGSSGIVGYHDDFLVQGPGIVIGRKGTLGVINYIEDNFFPIDTTYYIKSKTNSGKLFFEYFLLKEFAFEEMNSDSAVPGLNREIAESMDCLVPETISIYRFNYSCDPLFTKRTNNDIQIRTLSHLRDTLLPKLMSGEVKVRV